MTSVASPVQERASAIPSLTRVIEADADLLSAQLQQLRARAFPPTAEKQLRNVRGHLVIENAEVSGYEIHAGVTTGVALEQPVVRLDDGRCDGAQSADGQILGTYLHGVFESPAACSALLRWAGLQDVQEVDYHALRERDIERLADLVENHLDTAYLRALCRI